MRANFPTIVVSIVGVVVVGLVMAFLVSQLPEQPGAAEPTPGFVVLEPAAEVIVPSAASGPSREWVASTAASTGIGAIALDAYGRAALLLADEQPGCHVGWTTIAAVGGIESDHGTNGGSELLPDGTTTVRIVGPALDGTNGTVAIRSDEDSASWHGDRVWDHAVGPMQFIPSTWRQWGTDGSNDGIADPNNLLDASVAAARYLCASGSDLRTAAGWTRAIFSYNHSEEYVRNVLARANAYASSGG